MEPEEFVSLGNELLSLAGEYLRELPTKRVTRGETPKTIRGLLGQGSMPAKGTPPKRLLEDVSKLLFEHSLFNGHPRFWGYITSSPAPIGALGDLLAAVVNPNVGAYALSPVATEVERQTVKWISEMVRYDPRCGGLLVSGGNMANLVAFVTARTAKAPWKIQKEGAAGGRGRRLMVYASKETHVWVVKAADLFGLGTDSIHWIPVDSKLRMRTDALRRAIRRDLKRGRLPFLVVGTAGTVQTGAVDPLPELAVICKEFDLWFHVDGAYGAFAAMLPDAPKELRGMAAADSVALDPHKWLYAPLEAGCVLVKDEKLLRDTFSHHPAYYRFGGAAEDQPLNFYEYGMQNSRGFRALKVWLALKQVGLEGYRKMVTDDIELSRVMHAAVKAHDELEALTQNLSIATFRYHPKDLKQGKKTDEYLNRLNSELLERLQRQGDVFPSNAMVGGKFALRCCIVNFRTSRADVEALPEIVARLGAEVDGELRNG
jgi:aromatic-L-amino-acid decarboxylase